MNVKPVFTAAHRKWFNRAHDMNDTDRAAAAAYKTRQIVLIWECVRKANKWLTTPEVSQITGLPLRQVRRYMHRLGASGVCVVQVSPNRNTPMRIKAKRLRP